MSRISRIFILIMVLNFSSCGVFRLLNSGTVNLKYQVSQAKIDDIHYEEVERLRNPSFSIRNIQHPKEHQNWSANFMFTPSIHYNDTDLVAETITKIPNVNIKRGSLLGNAKITAHTPAGAFSLSVGAGGTMYKLDNGADLETIRTREITRVDLAWSAFLSKRFFVLAGPRYFKADYETYVFALRLGYYWGR